MPPSSPDSFVPSAVCDDEEVVVAADDAATAAHNPPLAGPSSANAVHQQALDQSCRVLQDLSIVLVDDANAAFCSVERRDEML